MSKDSESILFNNMRSMMSLIDKLRDFQLDNYISLPRIAVLGEQSAGKSSLLESVCGLNFLPRGSGIVTRRPLELRMVRSQVAEPYFVFPKDFPEKRFTKPEEIVATIEALTDKATNGTKAISDSPIVCSVYSASVPDLTLIDLPGITRNPVEGQPANIEEISKNLVAKYCSEQNTMILCVIPANIDLSTSDALAFDRKLDPEGIRTLGVMTKIDLMDEGENCKDILMNKVIPLRYGYVAVKGRSQLEVKNRMLVSEAIKKELDWFSKHPVYSMLPAEQLGTRALVDKMSTILFNMIQSYLPQLKSEVNSRLRQVKTQMEGLGEEFPEEEEKKLELVFRLVRKFKDSFDQMINGKYLYDKNDKKADKKDKDTETITFQLNTQFEELFKKYVAPDFKSSDDLKNEQIERALETYQASSMPGFYSIDSFLALINPKLEALKDPVITLLEDSKSVLESKGLELLDTVFKKFPKLFTEMRDGFLKFLVQRKNETRKILENMTKSEENYLFTNDPIIVVNPILEKATATMTARDFQIKEMRIRIDSYFSIVVRNLRDFVPKIIGQFLVKNFNANLEVELLNTLSKKNYCLETFNESDVTQSLRTKLKAEYTALQKADSLLVNNFNLGYSVNRKTINETAQSRQNKVNREVPMTTLDELNDIEALNQEFLSMNQALARRNPGVNLDSYSTQSEPYQREKTKEISRPLNDKSPTKVPPPAPTQNLSQPPAHSTVQPPPKTHTPTPSQNKNHDPFDTPLVTAQPPVTHGKQVSDPRLAQTQANPPKSYNTLFDTPGPSGAQAGAKQTSTPNPWANAAPNTGAKPGIGQSTVPQQNPPKKTTNNLFQDPIA